MMNADTRRRVLVEDVLETEARAPDAPRVGEVLDARHPVLQGRARVAWREVDDDVREAWLPCLQGLAVREGDRVLLQTAANWPEPLVTGVIDGFARRPEAPAREGARLALQADETLVVTAADEQPLLEVQQRPEGVRVRLLRDDVDVDLPGRLRLVAAELELRASAGDVTIAAGDDVVVTGEVIRLN